MRTLTLAHNWLAGYVSSCRDNATQLAEAGFPDDAAARGGVMPKRKKKTCRCGAPSLRGLAGVHPPCQFHWDEGNWGTAWAMRCKEEPLPPPSML